MKECPALLEYQGPHIAAHSIVFHQLAFLASASLFHSVVNFVLGESALDDIRYLKHLSSGSLTRGQKKPLGLVIDRMGQRNEKSTLHMVGLILDVLIHVLNEKIDEDTVASIFTMPHGYMSVEKRSAHMDCQHKIVGMMLEV